MINQLTSTECLISDIILSIGSFVFLLLLSLTYFSRDHENEIRIKLYTYILLMTLALVVTEFIEVLIILFVPNDLILIIAYKIHWGAAIVLFMGIYYYNLVYMDNIEANNLWDLINYSIHTKIMTVFHILSIIIYILLPFDLSKTSPTNMHYFPGLAAYWMYIYCSFVEGVGVVHLIRKNFKIAKRKRLGLWSIVIIIMISVVIQLIFPTIAIMVTEAVFQPFCLYFTVENPDLIMIEELESVKDNIEKTNRAKTDFLTNMSFEIKKPLNEILDYSKTLNNNQNVEDKKTNFRQIINSGNNLLYTVNNILAISRIESNDEELGLKEYSIQNVIKELVRSINPKLYNKQVKLVAEIDEYLPDKVYGDEDKLLQILMNILMNSVEHTEVGIIKLQMTGEKSEDQLKMHFKISDSGEGMSKEEFYQLTDMLTKLDEKSYSDSGNTGLGLAVCKKYLDLMNGKMRIESEFKAGTITQIELTQKIMDPTPIGPVDFSNINNNPTYRDCSRYKVLIVDDNKSNLVATSMILSKYHFAIETLDNAKDCIYKIKAEEKYDLIFIDHIMPEIDGIDTIHILRKLEGYQLPPIIVLTANTVTGMKELYLKEGFDDYLEKPINITELDKIINKYIK